MHERDYLKEKGYHDKYEILRNKVSAFLKKKSKRDVYNRAIQENKNSKLLRKNIKNISFADGRKNVEIPQKLKSSGGDVEGSLNIINELNSL